MTSPFDPPFTLLPIHVELFAAAGYTEFVDESGDTYYVDGGEVKSDGAAYTFAEFCAEHPHAGVIIPAADLLPMPTEAADRSAYKRGVLDALAYITRTGTANGVAADAALRQAGVLDTIRPARDSLDVDRSRLVRLLEVVPDGHTDEPMFSVWLAGIKREAAAKEAQRAAEERTRVRDAERAADRAKVGGGQRRDGRR